MNLSSEGAFVVFQHIVPEAEVPLGARVELKIASPTRLHGRIPLPASRRWPNRSLWTIKLRRHIYAA